MGRGGGGGGGGGGYSQNAGILIALDLNQSCFVGDFKQ